MIDERPWGRGLGAFGGIYPEILHDLSAMTQLPIATETSPLPRVLRDVANGHCQFTITSWGEGRAPSVTRGEVLAELDYGLILRSGLDLSDYREMKGRTIAWSRGLLIGEPFDNDPAVERFTTDGYDQAIAMVESGRADAAVGSMVTLESLTRRDGKSIHFGGRIVLTRVPLALQFENSFAATPEAARLNQAVRELRESGRSLDIIRRHFADQTD